MDTVTEDGLKVSGADWFYDHVRRLSLVVGTDVIVAGAYGSGCDHDRVSR